MLYYNLLCSSIKSLSSTWSRVRIWTRGNSSSSILWGRPQHLPSSFICAVLDRNNIQRRSPLRTVAAATRSQWKLKEFCVFSGIRVDDAGVYHIRRHNSRQCGSTKCSVDDVAYIADCVHPEERWSQQDSSFSKFLLPPYVCIILISIIATPNISSQISLDPIPSLPY